MDCEMDDVGGAGGGLGVEMDGCACFTVFKWLLSYIGYESGIIADLCLVVADCTKNSLFCNICYSGA